MAADPKNYKGREQSYIKHEFLSRYLRSAAYKILQGRSRVFNFVDAFAGPWNVSADDLSDASFDQALRTLESVRADLADLGKRGAAGLKLRFCFCEKDSSRAFRLREYAERHQGIEISVLQGAFEDHLDDIGNFCRDGFTFTFIDPTGWNIRSAAIFEFLREQNGEFLLNFMSEHINRHAEYPVVAESFGRFLADPEWSGEFDKLPDDWSNEQRVLFLLRQKIKNSGAASFLPDFPILKPSQNRVKMRLLLGTHSAKGLQVFRDVEQKVERRQIEMHNQGTQGQISLFTREETAALQQGATGVGCQRYRDEARTLIVSILGSSESLRFEDLANDLIEEIPLRLPDVNSLLAEMKDEGTVDYDLSGRQKVPRPNTRISLHR